MKRHHWNLTVCHDCGIHRAVEERMHPRKKVMVYHVDVVLDGIDGVAILTGKAPGCPGVKGPVVYASEPPNKNAELCGTCDMTLAEHNELGMKPGHPFAPSGRYDSASQIFKCDHGDACPGHARADDRPCCWGVECVHALVREGAQCPKD